MRDSTTRYLEQAAELGRRMGFLARREVSDSLLRVRLDDAYQPRVDLLWSLLLSVAQSRGDEVRAGFQFFRESMRSDPAIPVRPGGCFPKRSNQIALDWQVEADRTGIPPK
jgi:hypothetical protein